MASAKRRPTRSEAKKASTSYLKYSGLAFQMVFLLAAGWWIGSYGDQYFGFSEPYLAITGALLLLVGLFFKIYRDIMQDKL